MCSALAGHELFRAECSKFHNRKVPANNDHTRNDLCALVWGATGQRLRQWFGFVRFNFSCIWKSIRDNRAAKEQFLFAQTKIRPKPMGMTTNLADRDIETDRKRKETDFRSPQNDNNSLWIQSIQCGPFRAQHMRPRVVRHSDTYGGNGTSFLCAHNCLAKLLFLPHILWSIYLYLLLLSFICFRTLLSVRVWRPGRWAILVPAAPDRPHEWLNLIIYHCLDGNNSIPMAGMVRLWSSTRVTQTALKIPKRSQSRRGCTTKNKKHFVNCSQHGCLVQLCAYCTALRSFWLGDNTIVSGQMINCNGWMYA